MSFFDGMISNNPDETELHHVITSKWEQILRNQMGINENLLQKNTLRVKVWETSWQKE